MVNTAYAIGGVLARKKQWDERMETPFAAGTFEKIAGALFDGESRTDFVRLSVYKELIRRKRKQCESSEIRSSLDVSSVRKLSANNK